MRKFVSTLAFASIFALAASVSSAETISGSVDAVTVSKDNIRTASLQGVSGSVCGKPDKLGKGEACYLAFSANPGWFKGKDICVSGRRDFWAVRPDGTLVSDGLRKLTCAPIGADGKVSLTFNYPTGFDPFIASGGKIDAWASRDSLGLPTQ